MSQEKLNAALVSDLWFFTVAARHGSFTVAAKELHVTQGAVSQRIRQLEQRLELELFNRVGRSIQLSDAGHRLYTACQGSFDQMDDVLQRLLARKGSSTLEVSCFPTVAMEWLIPRLDHFNQQHDSIRLRIKAELHKLNQNQMRLDAIDIALRYDMESYPDLETIPLMEEKIFPVCSPAYKEKNKDAIEARDFAQLTMLHDSMPWDGAEPTQEWETWFQGHGMVNQDADQGIFFNFAQLAYRAAVADQGVAMGRSLLVADFLKEGKLVRLYDGEMPSGAFYRIITPKKLPKASPEKFFVDWLHQEFLKSLAQLAV